MHSGQYTLQREVSATIPRTKVSIVIPSYGRGRALVRLVRQLATDRYRDKEIIVVLDMPDPSVIEELENCNSCRVIVNTSRKGKVNALNTALKHASGELLIFMDDDVEIEDEEFVEKVIRNMADCDIGDIKKVIKGRGLLGNLVYIEYMTLNFASKLFHKWAKRSVAVNGAAFAMWRKALREIGAFRPVISEDLDLSIRAFLAGHRFCYIDDTYVWNHAPEGWRQWLKQRKRWAIGLALWLREYVSPLLRALKRMPHIIIPSLILVLPSILTTMLIFLLKDNVYAKSLYLLLLTLSSMVGQFLPIASLVSVNLHFLFFSQVINILVVFSVLSILYVIAAYSVKMKSKFYLYPVYFLVYQPLWLTILLAGFIRVYLLKKEDVEDWVV